MNGNSIKQIMESNKLQLENLKEFYAVQNETLSKELTEVNNKQITELKKGYADNMKNQKEQFESSTKEMEKHFYQELERQKNELTHAKLLQQEMKELGIQEGKMTA
jgi:hypothetical protein